MATTKSEIKERYPIPVYGYKVRINSETVGFSEVSGLNLQYDTITYRHGLSVLEGTTLLPGIQQPVNLTLRRGLVKGKSQLLDWINTIQLSEVSKRDIFIDLCDELGTPVITWKAIDAFPTSLEAPNFDAASNEVAIESISLMAASLQVEYHEFPE